MDNIAMQVLCHLPKSTVYIYMVDGEKLVSQSFCSIYTSSSSFLTYTGNIIMYTIHFWYKIEKSVTESGKIRYMDPAK